MYKNPPHNQIHGWSDILTDQLGYKTDGFFVEVGAFDGRLWSPCFTLACAGWPGIFFEPSASAWAILNSNYANRPDITCARKAISDFVGYAALYIGGSTSTIRDDTRALYLDVPELQSAGLGANRKETVGVSTLDIELPRLGAPVGFDVLVIDVEGSEMDVLRGFDCAEWLPKLVVIEAHELHGDYRMRAKAGPINDYMDALSYKKIYSDSINNIYVLGACDEN